MQVDKGLLDDHFLLASDLLMIRLVELVLVNRLDQERIEVIFTFRGLAAKHLGSATLRDQLDDKPSLRFSHSEAMSTL